MNLKRVFLFALLCGLLAHYICPTELSAQENERLNEFIIEDIKVIGNKRTKTAYILREMTLRAGQSVQSSELDTLLKVNANQIYNTELFNEVLVEPVYGEGKALSLEVKVRERWYFIPLVYFELADQNFNVWWKQFDHDLARTKYGAGIEMQNMRGRNEDFKIDFRQGFTRQYRFRYKFPFIDRAKTIGMELLYFYVSHNEMPYTIRSNRFQFFDLNAQVDVRQEGYITFTRRKAIKHSQTLSFGVQTFRVAQEIVDRNEVFFDGKEKQQGFAEIKYVQQWDNRDIRRYPLVGSLARFTLRQRGLGFWKDFNQTYLEAHASKYWKVGTKQYLAANTKVATSFPDQQAFSNRIRVGYESNFIRGYEQYIAEADHFVSARVAAKQMLLNIKWKPKWIKREQFSLIPIKVMLKTYTEAAKLWGYDTDRRNSLNGNYLVGGGIGLDIITFHDSLYSIEYSMNRRRERGIFMHFNITWDKG